MMTMLALKREIITLYGNHEITEANSDRLGFQKQSVIAFIDLGIASLNGVERGFRAQGLR